MKLDGKLMAAIISAIEAYLQMEQGQPSQPRLNLAQRLEK